MKYLNYNFIEPLICGHLKVCISFSHCREVGVESSNGPAWAWHSRMLCMCSYVLLLCD